MVEETYYVKYRNMLRFMIIQNAIGMVLSGATFLVGMGAVAKNINFGWVVLGASVLLVIVNLKGLTSAGYKQEIERRKDIIGRGK